MNECGTETVRIAMTAWAHWHVLWFQVVVSGRRHVSQESVGRLATIWPGNLPRKFDR